MAMRIDVRDRGFKAPEGLRNYVGLRLMSVLDHLVREVDGVTVGLADVHAPKGGLDKRCRMLALLGTGEVHVEETASDPYAAIDRAAGRLAAGIEERPRK
jgi:ribosome-associated translation inhibitor RaiA